jgi:FixJ family two-component response regulator
MPLPNSTSEIFIVDDDPAIRETLSILFSTEGYNVVCFAEGTALLAATKIRSPTCVVLDVYIPGKSGIDILKELTARDGSIPIFIISGQGDIAMAVEAIKNGALDFIEKPFRGSTVVARVRDALEAQAQLLHGTEPAESSIFYFPDREPLSPRERNVLACLATGVSNRDAATQLGISPRTIEIHRAHIMEKLGARNAIDLIRIVMSQGRSR